MKTIHKLYKYLSENLLKIITILSENYVKCKQENMNSVQKVYDFGGNIFIFVPEFTGLSDFSLLIIDYYE